jgi:NitT/TauT family transport system substrate-binding protein
MRAFVGRDLRTHLLGTLILLLVFAGCGRATPEAQLSGELEPVTLAMGYVPNVQFTPLYVAVERGYFAEAGIEVSFDYGMEHDLLKLAGTNELQFVIGSGDQVILARSQELPVVYVFNWYRRFPVSVAALRAIDDPQDLIGLDVGIPGLYGASYIGWQALLGAADVDPTAVNLVSVGYTQVESLVTEQVDAVVVYAMNEPVQLREQGHEVHEIEVAEYIDFISNGLITNEQTMEERPELVRAVVQAMRRGLQDTLDDPDAAFAVCRQYVPEITDESAPLQRAVLDAALRFWQAENLGRSDPAAWQAALDFMREIGMIEGALKAEQLYSNEFVD